VIDRTQLRQALGLFVVLFNDDAPDYVLCSAARTLAPLVSKIVADSDDATREEVRALLATPPETEGTPDA
jgi:hypothetical protein